MTKIEKVSYDFERRYQYIINNISSVVGELDLDGIFTYINPYIHDELGYKPEEVIGQAIYEFIHPDDVKKIIKVLRRETKSRGITPEIRLKNNKNQFIWFEINARRIKDCKSEIRIIINLKNISKFKLLEKKLQENQENYQKITDSFPEIQFWKVITPKKYKGAIHATSEMLKIIIENIPQCVYWKDTEFKYLGCNSNFTEFVGLIHPENVIGKTNEELFSNKEKFQQIREYENIVVQSGKPVYHTNEIWITAERKEIWLDINRVPLFDTDGKVIGILITFEEITDRKIAEEKLQKSEEKYKNLSNELETVLDIIPGMIFIKNKDDVYTRVNQVFADYLQLDKEEIIGKSTLDLFPQDLATNLRRDDLEAISSSVPKLNVKETANFPSDTMSSIISKIPYYNEKEEINGIIGLAIDISERKELEQRLIKSEGKYQILVEKSLQGICILQDIKFVFSNKTLARMLGYSVKELYSMSSEEVINLIYEVDREWVLKHHKDRINNKDVPSHYEFRVIRKDNQIIWVEMYASMIEYDGKPAVQEVFIDITDKKNVEQKLKESEEKFRTIAEQSLIGIQILQDNRTKYINQQWAKISGFSIEEIMKWNLEDHLKFIHPDDRELVRQELDKKQKGVLDAINQYQVRCIKKNGETIWVEIFAKSINYEGKFADFIMIFDITKPKLIQQELRESEKKFRTAVENSPDFMVFIKRDGTIFDINRLEKGFTRETIIGQSIFNENFYETKDQCESVRNAIIDSLNTGEMTEYEYSQIAPNSSISFYETRVSPFGYDDEDRIISFQLTTRDISERKKAEKSISESKQLFERTFNTLRDGIFILNAENPPKILNCNQSAEEIFGYSTKEMLDQTTTFLHTDITMLKKFQQELYPKIEKGGDLLNFKFEMKRKDGTIFPSEHSVVPLYDENNNRIGWISTIRDITDRKKAEQKLKDSEFKYRTLFEEALTPIFITDENGIYVDANKAALDFVECDIDELRKHNVFDFTPPQLLEKRRQDHYPFYKKNTPETEYYINGKIKTLLLNIVPFEMEENKFYFSIGPDITARKTTEEKLKESEEKYRNLVETSSMGLLELNIKKGGVVYVNPRLLEIVGYTQDELISQGMFYKAIYPDDYKKVTISEEDKDMELRIINKEGKIKWLSGRTLHQFNEQGELIYLRLWLQDITEAKELEEIKSNLLTRISHEIKTPLISIKGFTDLLLTEYKSSLNKQIISFLERIKEGGEKLKLLINHFLETEMLDIGLVKLNESYENLSILIKKEVEEMEGLIKLRNQIITVDIPDEIMIFFDKEKIQSVISNLLTNAIKYTPSGGNITVKSRIKKNSLIISIRDDGIGLQKKEMAQLFKPFGKIEKYGRGWDIITDGIGLGLYLSKEIIELHGGRIGAESQGENKGSTFYFSLPIIKK